MIEIYTFEVNASAPGTRADVVATEIDILSEMLRHRYGVELQVELLKNSDKYSTFQSWLAQLQLKSAPFFGEFGDLGRLYYLAHKAGIEIPQAPKILCLPEATQISDPLGAHGYFSPASDTLNHTVVLSKYYPQIIYHEFLHMFGVEESYITTSKQTIPGCAECWMQWEPSSGSGLAPERVAELKNYLLSHPECGQFVQ